MPGSKTHGANIFASAQRLDYLDEICPAGDFFTKFFVDRRRAP